MGLNQGQALYGGYLSESDISDLSGQRKHRTLEGWHLSIALLKVFDCWCQILKATESVSLSRCDTHVLLHTSIDFWVGLFFWQTVAVAAQRGMDQ